MLNHRVLSQQNHLLLIQVIIKLLQFLEKNEKMKEAFEKLVSELHAEDIVKVLPYTTQVPELMSIADFVVTKPGGLTSTESLASRLPMVLINPIPGQEEENAQFLENAGVGIWLNPKENCDEIITELLNDENKLNQMRKNTELLAKKNSTMDICRTILPQ
jgi:processive 1,2-diacylglycerol beta-glucosyltransferase